MRGVHDPDPLLVLPDLGAVDVERDDIGLREQRRQGHEFCLPARGRCL
jgi:hypothetical protein